LKPRHDVRLALTIDRGAPALHWTKVQLSGGSDLDTPTFRARAVLLTRADVPDAEVTALVEAVVGHFDVFHVLLPVLADLTPSDLASVGSSAPLHPAAENALRRTGLLN
jgi:hypothetical protein